MFRRFSPQSTVLCPVAPAHDRGDTPSIRARSMSSVQRVLGELWGDELCPGQTEGHWDLSHPLVPHWVSSTCAI